MRGKAAAMRAAPTAAPLQRGADALSRLNDAWFAPRGLACPQSLGVREDGWKILDIVEAHDVQRFSYLALEVQNPKGEKETRRMRFMANTAKGGRGCVLVVMVNDHIATVRQFRLPVMIASGLAEGFTTELPRQFASAEVMTTILDLKLRQATAHRMQISDPALRAEIRTLLGNELGKLMSQPGIEVEQIVSLGSVSEWEESFNLVEVVLVRLTHPNLLALKQLDLGPAHLRIRLYPFDQLLVHERRRAVNFCDQMSLAGLALCWGHLKRNGVAVRRSPEWVKYTFDEPDGRVLLTNPFYRRTLDAVNAGLIARGQHPLDGLGASSPAALILSVDPVPFYSGDGWSIRGFRRKSPFEPTGEGTYYIRIPEGDVHEEALIPIVNGVSLLTVRAHHLPLLMDADLRRAWCNRTTTMKSDPTRQPNPTSQHFGMDDAHLEYLSPGERLMVELMRRAAPFQSRVVGRLWEDTGANAVARTERIAELELSDPETVIEAVNAEADRKAKLVATPIEAAIRDPEAHGVRDMKTLAALLVAAGHNGALSLA